MSELNLHNEHCLIPKKKTEASLRGKNANCKIIVQRRCDIDLVKQFTCHRSRLSLSIQILWNVSLEVFNMTHTMDVVNESMNILVSTNLRNPKRESLSFTWFRECYQVRWMLIELFFLMGAKGTWIAYNGLYFDAVRKSSPTFVCFHSFVIVLSGEKNKKSSTYKSRSNMWGISEHKSVINLTSEILETKR